MSNPWQPKFVPAHHKPKDPFKRAQLAPVQRVEPVLCARCGHLRLKHDDGPLPDGRKVAGYCWGTPEVDCDCTEYVEA